MSTLEQVDRPEHKTVIIPSCPWQGAVLRISCHSLQPAPSRTYQFTSFSLRKVFVDPPLKHQLFPSTLCSGPQYLHSYLDFLLKCFTRCQNYGIAPHQSSGSTAARVNKPVRLCSHNSPFHLSLFKLLIHCRCPKEPLT